MEKFMQQLRVISRPVCFSSFSGLLLMPSWKVHVPVCTWVCVCLGVINTFYLPGSSVPPRKEQTAFAVSAVLVLCYSVLHPGPVSHSDTLLHVWATLPVFISLLSCFFYSYPPQEGMFSLGNLAFGERKIWFLGCPLLRVEEEVIKLGGSWEERKITFLLYTGSLVYSCSNLRNTPYPHA